MARVDVCPDNLTTITEASTRLGCGKDEYGNDQYICLPTADMSSFVEFCYNGIMGYHEKGNCLQASKGNLTLSPCVEFSSGCPSTIFKSSDFYKYSACQNLDLENRCYKMDPKCPQNIEEKMSVTQAGFIGFIAAAAISIVIIFVLFVLAYMYLRKRRKQRKTKKIAGDYKETTNEEDQEMHNFPSDEHPDRPFLKKDAEIESTDIIQGGNLGPVVLEKKMNMGKVYDNNKDNDDNHNDDGHWTNFDQKSSLQPSAQHSEMESNEPVEKCVKKNGKLRSSMDRLTDDTLHEMEQLYPGKEALNIAESAVLRVKKCIDKNAKTIDVFTNLIVVSKLFTMFTNSPNLSTSEFKATRCFLSKVFKTPQFSFENIKKLSEERKKYSVWSDDTDDIWSRAPSLEERLIQRNRELSNIRNDASKHENDVLENNNCESAVREFLWKIKTDVKESILEPVKSTRTTAYVNLYFRIAILHSFVLWQSFCIKRRSASSQLSTAFSEIKTCQNSNLSMLQYISHPVVEHAVFLSVCHLTENENIRNFLEIQDIKPFVLSESFYAQKHYIQCGKTPDVKLQMRPYIYGCGVLGTNSVTGMCEFNFVSVNRREMDNICYIRSAHLKDYYIRMSENGSCDAVKNIPEKGGEWKFVPLGINQEQPIFIISSTDWPGNFLSLEPDKWSVKGESDLQKFKVNGLWKICDV